MSTTKQSRFAVLLTYYIVPGCFATCVISFYEGKELTGWGLLILAILLRLSILVETHQKATQKTDEAVVEPTEPDDYGEGVFHLSLTTPQLASSSGWETLSVYERLSGYKRILCHGGPPVMNEHWEYEIKEGGFGRHFVFQRLRDDHIEDLWDDRYEVVNGSVQEHLIESRYAERELKVYPPEEKIADLKTRVRWHEAEGVVKYFILSNVRPFGGWKREVEKLKESVAKVSMKAEELGATLNEYGWYELPESASDEEKFQLDTLFSPSVLRNQYGIRSYRDWRERDHIFKLLEPTATQERV